MHFEEARACVLREVRGAPPIERVSLEAAAGRVLAQDVAADRDYPALPRSTRDGYAVRAEDPGKSRKVAGEVRAGELWESVLKAGEAIEIMTGAPVPDGADAVIMVEHCGREGDTVILGREIREGDAINPRGSECRSGEVVVKSGTRLDHTHVAMLATFGWSQVPVYRLPRVAILATGDEIVGVADTPSAFQIRNSNSAALASQVRRAGGCPEVLPVARDEAEATRDLVSYGLTFDLLLLSGGVSAGKYDIVESVLSELGSHFFFDRVLIQPGQPLVFGKAGAAFFFGLPGNPASSMVTFELFARNALDRLSGVGSPELLFSYGILKREFRHKPGLTRFLPAHLSGAGEVTPIKWQGSSDIPSLTRANVFLVAEHDRESWQAGDHIRVLMK